MSERIRCRIFNERMSKYNWSYLLIKYYRTKITTYSFLHNVSSFLSITRKGPSGLWVKNCALRGAHILKKKFTRHLYFGRRYFKYILNKVFFLLSIHSQIFQPGQSWLPANLIILTGLKRSLTAAGKNIISWCFYLLKISIKILFNFEYKCYYYMLLLLFEYK